MKHAPAITNITVATPDARAVRRSAASTRPSSASASPRPASDAGSSTTPVGAASVGSGGVALWGTEPVGGRGRCGAVNPLSPTCTGNPASAMQAPRIAISIVLSSPVVGNVRRSASQPSRVASRSFASSRVSSNATRLDRKPRKTLPPVVAISMAPSDMISIASIAGVSKLRTRRCERQSGSVMKWVSFT